MQFELKSAVRTRDSIFLPSCYPLCHPLSQSCFFSEEPLNAFQRLLPLLTRQSICCYRDSFPCSEILKIYSSKTARWLMSKLLSTNAKQKMFTLLQWLTLLSQEGVKNKKINLKKSILQMWDGSSLLMTQLWFLATKLHNKCILEFCSKLWREYQHLRAAAVHQLLQHPKKFN